MIQNAVLADYTYMKVGGPADFLTIANTTDELIRSVNQAKAEHRLFFILGGGSNTIFSDKGFRGLVIINRSNDLSISLSNQTVKVSSGVPVNLLVNQTTEAGLAGLEEFLGIPGSVGGAIYNNSHYLTHLMSEHLLEVEYLNQGKLIASPAKDLHFAYDYSLFQETHYPIIRATFQLTTGDRITLKQTALAALKRRKDTQPLEFASSGCIFKNGNGVTSAGSLIDQAGLKGLKHGGAEVSTKHANFIINTNGATAQDIFELSNKISDTIKAKFNLTLKREVFFLDEFGHKISE